MKGLSLVLVCAVASLVLGASNADPAPEQIKASLRLAIEDTLDGAAFKTAGSGGVTQLEIGRLDVSGDRAIVSGRSLDSIRSTTLGSTVVSTPTAWDRVSATLLRVDGSWLVSELSLQPEQSGP